MDVLIKNQAEEQAVVRICNAWARAHPERYARFLRLIQRDYESLYRSDGISKEGHFGYEGKIPVDLAYVLHAKFPHLWDDPKLLMFVHKVLMGKYLPKPSKNFHIIDRRK